MMGRKSPFTDKKYISALLVILFYLLFINSNDTEFGPEQLEAYRAELAEYVKNNIEELRDEQAARKNAVREVCDKYGLNQRIDQIPHQSETLEMEDEERAYLKRINWQYVYLSVPQSLTWCKVPKAGSSTWTYNFLKLAGQTTNSTKIHKLLRDYFPKLDKNKDLKDTFKFMVVRHPFERLLSAYRDKLEDLSRDLAARDGYYFTMYGRHIVSEYRDKSDRNLTGVSEPTWREFITYIINTPPTKFDEHWMPIWMLCSPCLIRYNVIAKMETFSEDTQYILEEAGLDTQLEVEWKHRTGTGGSSDIMLEYFSQLTLAEIGALFHKYQLDFELYGYSPEPYFDIAIQEP